MNYQMNNLCIKNFDSRNFREFCPNCWKFMFWKFLDWEICERLCSLKRSLWLFCSDFLILSKVGRYTLRIQIYKMTVRESIHTLKMYFMPYLQKFMAIIFRILTGAKICKISKPKEHEYKQMNPFMTCDTYSFSFRL